MNRESEGKSSGIPHLAKNERDVGHPSFVRNQRPAPSLYDETRDGRLLLRRLIGARRRRGLGAVWTLVDQGDMKGQLGVGGLRFGLFLRSSSSFGVLGHDRMLRV